MQELLRSFFLVKATALHDVNIAYDGSASYSAILCSSSKESCLPCSRILIFCTQKTADSNFRKSQF